MAAGMLAGMDSQLLGINKMAVVVVDIPHCDEVLVSLGDPASDEIAIHLGVNAKATCVNVEQRAYNNMTFRVPDECGLQPCEEKINPRCELDSAMETNFPVGDIVAALQREGHNIVVSSDPGRFICNYMYYSSLKRYERVGLPLNALFIHLPPFDVLDYDSQVRTVSAIINAIGRHYLAC
jgi:pyroglutamyl-peptidase